MASMRTMRAMPTAAAAAAAVLAGWAVAGASAVAVGNRAGTVEACNFKTTGGQTIDFNVLASKGLTETGDYTITSEQFDRYEYVFNMCDKLNFVDDACPEGSAVCDRSISSEKSVNVWGSIGNVTVTYQDYHGLEDKVPTMEFDSQAPCYYRPQKVTVFKIYLLCNADAIDAPILSLDYEDYLECEVDVNFETAVACGDGPTKYSCNDYKCTASAEGTMSAAECLKSCVDPNPPQPTPPPSPSRYSCNSGVEPGVCFLAEAGEYESKESCDAACKYVPPKWKCNGDRCETDPSGAYESEQQCLAVCKPDGKKYACNDATKKCEEDESGKYPSAAACEAECTAPDTKYRCEDDKCVEAETGLPLDTCKAACVAVDSASKDRHGVKATRPFLGYKCVQGKVKAVVGGGVDHKTAVALCNSKFEEA